MTTKRGRRGEVSVQMTASDLISLAVNVANGWSLDDLGGGSRSAALRDMVAEVYDQILQANRRAAGRAAAFRRDERRCKGWMLLEKVDDRTTS